MTYVVTLYRPYDDKYVTSTLYDVTGVEALGHRLHAVVEYHERHDNETYIIVSVVLVGNSEN